MCFGLVCCGIESLVALFCCGCTACCRGGGEKGDVKANVRIGYSIAKWFYCIGFALTAIAVWVLRDYTGGWMTDHIAAFDKCQDLGDLKASCTGKEIALRVSFGNFVFFAAHLLVTLGLSDSEDGFRASLHAGGWFWKLILWIGCLIGFFFVPARAVYGYAQAARVGAGLFLIVQLVLLIAFAYEVNELLTARWERWWSKTLLVVGTVLGMCAALALIGISYHFYAPARNCSLNIFFITWTLIMGLAMVAVLFIPNKAASAGLLTSAAIWLYCAWIVYSALNSEPKDYRCVRGAGTSYKWITIVAFFIALFTVMYSTITAGVGSNDFFGKPDGVTVTGISPNVDEPLPYRADFFHLVFALGSMYIAMLFSSWAVGLSTQQFQIDQGWASTWVKMASVWVCELMYLWTVIAPALLRDRDFSVV